MTDIKELKVVHQKAEDLFPTHIVETNDYSSYGFEIDISFVSISILHSPDIIQSGNITEPLTYTRDGKRVECIQTFHSIEEVEEYRNNICFLSEKPTDRQSLDNILYNMKGWSETDE